MSGRKGSGTGSPIAFRCREARHNRYHDRNARISVTGRTRPYRRRGRAIGSRSVHTSYEYKCECGYTGWSNHVDLARLADDREALARRGFRS